MNTTSKIVVMAALALASLAIAVTIQQQDVAAFNDNNNQGVANTHDHFQFGSLEGNGGIVTNSKLTHSNENTNTHRDDQTKTNSFLKPGNDK